MEENYTGPKTTGSGKVDTKILGIESSQFLKERAVILENAYLVFHTEISLLPSLS